MNQEFKKMMDENFAGRVDAISEGENIALGVVLEIAESMEDERGIVVLTLALDMYRAAAEWNAALVARRREAERAAGVEG